MKKLLSFLITLILAGTAGAQSNGVENTYFTHLQQIYFENSANQYNEYLLPALKNYFVRFPQSTQEDQITFMLAKTLQKERRNFSSFYYFARLLFVYQASTLRRQAAQNADSLLLQSHNMAFHEQRDSLHTVFISVKPGSEEQENLFAFFSFIYMLNIDSLQSDLLEDIDRYRIVYGITAPYSDLLLMWKAQIYLHKHDYFAARASLLELIALYPKSAIMPKTLLASAKLSEKPLRKYDEAREYLLKIMNDFPASEESAEAQFLLGRLYENDFKNRRLAIENYRLFIQNFPENRLRCQAFRRLAHLLEQEKIYSEALQTYMQYYQVCADSSGAADALQQILRIAKEKLHDRQRYAETLLLLAAKTENDSLSADYLYQAAETFAGLNGQSERARRTCHLIIKQFSGTKSAMRAKKLLHSFGKK